MPLQRIARQLVCLGLLLAGESSALESSALAEDHAEAVVEAGAATALEPSAAVAQARGVQRPEDPQTPSSAKKKRRPKKYKKRRTQQDRPTVPLLEEDEEWDQQGDHHQDAPYPVSSRIARRMREAREESARMAERRLEKERAEVLKNRADLKREFYEKTGEELTDETIDAALQKAWDERPKRFEGDHKLHLVSKIPGLEEHYTPPSRRLQGPNEVTKGKNGILVSALSPGWDWNYGMNLFWCVGFDQIKPSFLPKPRQRLKMVDCQLTPALQTGIKYTTGNDLKWQNTDGIFWDWCIETNKVKNGILRVDICDITNPLQQWLLVHVKGSGGKIGDGTWRPLVDENKCVTGHPSKAGRDGAGRLKVNTCSNKGKKRKAQTWIFCEDNNACETEVDKNNDSGYIECAIKTECKIVEP